MRRLQQVEDGAIEILMVRARGWRCALRIEDVVETFRPLAVQPVEGAPAFVRGVSIVRGAPTPVVDLAVLLGATDGARGGRVVAVRTGGGRVALEVDEVVGVRRIPRALLVEAPPLLGGAVRAHVEALGVLDGDLLAVLSAAQLLPEALLSAAPWGGAS